MINARWIWFALGLLFPMQAEIRDERWLAGQRARYERELQSYREAVGTFNREADDARKESIGRLVDWVREKANGLFGISGEPGLLMQTLTTQNLETFKQALKGNWGPYRDSLAEAIFNAGVPEWFDLTIVEQSLDFIKLGRLRQTAQELDRRGEALLRIEKLITQAQKDLTAQRTKRNSPAKPAPPPAVLEKDYSELDKAIAELNQEDKRHLNEFAAEKTRQDTPRDKSRRSAQQCNAESSACWKRCNSVANQSSSNSIGGALADMKALNNCLAGCNRDAEACRAAAK